MRSRDLLSDSQTLGGQGSQSPFSKGLVVVGVAIVLLLLIGTLAYFKGESLKVPVDSGSLCPIDRPPTEVVAILLDPSDRIAEPQQIQLRNLLARVRDGVPRFGLIEVYRLDKLASSVPEPSAHLCNPGTGRDLSRIYQNPELAAHRWRTFADTLMKEISRQVSVGPQPTSPIFEAVRAISVRTFNQPAYDGLPKHLVIVSDLLQHVPGSLDMYKELPPFDAFRQGTYFAEVRADLAEVHVFIIYLNRPTVSIQGRSHIEFWRAFFSDQGAVVDSVYRLFGPA